MKIIRIRIIRNEELLIKPKKSNPSKRELEFYRRWIQQTERGVRI